MNKIAFLDGQFLFFKKKIAFLSLTFFFVFSYNSVPLLVLVPFLSILAVSSSFGKYRKRESKRFVFFFFFE